MANVDTDHDYDTSSKPLKKWHKDAKVYRLVGRQHSGFSEDGTERQEFTFGDEVKLDPIEYGNFKDKFEEVDEHKARKPRKSAADAADEANKDLKEDPPAEPTAGAPVGEGKGMNQGSDQKVLPTVAGKPATASDSAPTGQEPIKPTSADKLSAGSPGAVKAAQDDAKK